jgi:hypothetical protein
MSKVTVYQYKVLDTRRLESGIARRWGTREAIARLRNAVILEETATRVDASLINMGGFTQFGFDPHSGN